MYWARSSAAERDVDLIALGRAAYDEVLTLQRRLHARRASGRIRDVVLTVEHDPVFTFGRGGSEDDLLAPRAAVEAAGIGIQRVERGGGVTYHGPGQIVVYPIIDLRSYGRDLKRYVERLEEAMIAALEQFGVSAERRVGYPGVWVNGSKIASIGIHVQRWVTSHGLALNVAVDRGHFAMIRPCGLPVEVASIADFISSAPDLATVETRLLDELARRFGWRLAPCTVEEAVT